MITITASPTLRQIFSADKCKSSRAFCGYFAAATADPTARSFIRAGSSLCVPDALVCSSAIRLAFCGCFYSFDGILLFVFWLACR